MKVHESWFTPYPTVIRGSDAAQEDLDNLDKDIEYLEGIYASLREQRAKARHSTDRTQGVMDSSLIKAQSEYLDIVENQRRAETELDKLREERLKLVLLADLAYEPDRRGDSFPFGNVEDKAKELLQRQKDRLLAVSTVAFFGAGITFSSIMSGTRGSIGLMSYSWAAFSISFSMCIYAQWTNPINLPYTIVAYPGRRIFMNYAIFATGAASFVGIMLMGVSVATLKLAREGDEIVVDTRINPAWGGVLSLAPFIFGFTLGTLNLLYNAFVLGRQKRARSLAHRALEPGHNHTR